MMMYSFRKVKHKIYKDCWYLYFNGKKTIFKVAYLVDYEVYHGSAVFKDRREVYGLDLQEAKRSLIEAVTDNYKEEQYWTEEPLMEIILRMPVRYPDEEN